MRSDLSIQVLEDFLEVVNDILVDQEEEEREDSKGLKIQLIEALLLMIRGALCPPTWRKSSWSKPYLGL